MNTDRITAVASVRKETTGRKSSALGGLGLEHVVFLHPETWTSESISLLGDAAARLSAGTWLTYPNGE